MNVFPQASTTSKLSDKVAYNFRIHPVGASGADLNTNFDIVCTTSGGGATMTCNAPQSLTKTATIGAAATTCGSTDDICVFAGLRSDPFFFDLNGFNATVTGNKPAFTGANFFQGLNVLSIVVEVNAAKMFNNPVLPFFAVAAETTRNP